MQITDKEILEMLIVQKQVIEYFLMVTPVGVHNLSSIEHFRELIIKSENLINILKNENKT